MGRISPTLDFAMFKSTVKRIGDIRTKVTGGDRVFLVSEKMDSVLHKYIVSYFRVKIYVNLIK